jgi:signal transduction histidine kinase
MTPNLNFPARAMPKKLNPFLILAFLLSIAWMLVLSWNYTREMNSRLDLLALQGERREVAGQLLIELEKYRRQVGAFRSMSESEISASKSSIRHAMDRAVEMLAVLGESTDGTQQAHEISVRFDDLVSVSAKVEPLLYSKDVFMRSIVQDSYSRLVQSIDAIRSESGHQAEGLRAELKASDHEFIKWMGLAAISSLGWFFLVLFFSYWFHARPLSRLWERLSAGNLMESPPKRLFSFWRANPKKLKGVFGEIEKRFKDLSNSVERLQGERHQFISSVALELRSPLMVLQSSAEMLNQHWERLSSSQREQVATAMSGSAYRLNRSIADLTDILESDRGSIRLEEKIVDIREVIERVAAQIGGPGTTHPIGLVLPSIPLWAFVDPERLERVLVNVISRVSSGKPQGGSISIKLLRHTQGRFRGLEILIQDGAANQEGGWSRSTGPEQDLLRHWVSESGFGMALCHRILQAHGGTITAAGLAGSLIHFSLKIPQERIAMGFISPIQSEEGRVGAVDHLDSGRVKCFLDEASKLKRL